MWQSRASQANAHHLFDCPLGSPAGALGLFVPRFAYRHSAADTWQMVKCAAKLGESDE